MKRTIRIERQGNGGGFRLYTPDEAAQILRCKASWLKEQARQRLIPFTMVAGSYRFTLDHLAQIVTANEHEPTDAPLPGRRHKTDDPPAETVRLRARRPRRRTQTS